MEPFVRRIKVQNYKSIARCDLELGPLTVLVGRNGSGKSNFLDALRFVADSLQSSLDHAVKSRGGIDAVRRRSHGHPHNFAVGLELNLSDFRVADYSFEVAAKAKGAFQVKSESLRVTGPAGRVEAYYKTSAGQLVDASMETMPAAAADRLYLVAASGLPDFRAVYDALSSMGFYNLNPDQMKEVQSPDAGELLRRDGSNVASVVARLAEDRPELVERIRDYLTSIVPDVVDFRRVPLGHRETLEFRQKVKGAEHPWKFHAASMSDGTLRALGILVAVVQLVDREQPVRLVGIEEPETALHPAAAGKLVDSLREGAAHTQVVLTTHSPDLIDCIDEETDRLLVVQVDEGTTHVGPADQASLEAIKTHLFSPGDLLRLDQLQPDASEIERQLAMSFDGA